MRGLRLFLSPFAPDTSGAAAVFFAAGGLAVILDAGGCAGNICAFDEPRWGSFRRDQIKSAVFSAGLRDMDAILGRDERLMQKLVLAAEEIEADFVAIIGTPVPAVIGTDFSSLKRLLEKKLPCPVVTVETDGTGFYDEGVSKAQIALLQTFLPKRKPGAIRKITPGSIGLLGVTPLDTAYNYIPALKDKLRRETWDKIICYGIDDGVEGIRAAAMAERNIAVTAAGEGVARFLERGWGTPFEVYSPGAEVMLTEALKKSGLELSTRWQRILIVGEEFSADALRRTMRKTLPKSVIICGTWFLQRKKYAEPQDKVFAEEDEFQNFVRDGKFDCIVADAEFKRALPFYRGDFVAVPHYAVSGAQGSL